MTNINQQKVLKEEISRCLPHRKKLSLCQERETFGFESGPENVEEPGRSPAWTNRASPPPPPPSDVIGDMTNTNLRPATGGADLNPIGVVGRSPTIVHSKCTSASGPRRAKQIWAGYTDSLAVPPKLASFRKRRFIL